MAIRESPLLNTCRDFLGINGRWALDERMGGNSVDTFHVPLYWSFWRTSTFIDIFGKMWVSGAPRHLKISTRNGAQGHFWGKLYGQIIEPVCSTCTDMTNKLWKIQKVWRTSTVQVSMDSPHNVLKIIKCKECFEQILSIGFPSFFSWSWARPNILDI